MKVTLTKKNFLLWETAVIAIGTIVIYGIIEIFLPEHYFLWFPLIPLFFYIFGIYSIYMFDKCRLKAPGKLLIVYMGVKFAKLILSLVIVLFYTLRVKEQTEDFIIVFFLYYLLSMVFQSWFFVLYEANKMKQKRNKECLNLKK